MLCVRLAEAVQNGGTRYQYQVQGTSSWYHTTRCTVSTGTTIHSFSEERFGLVLLIVDPCPEKLLERHLIRLVLLGAENAC